MARQSTCAGKTRGEDKEGRAWQEAKEHVYVLIKVQNYI
jgi:hypothetical protein